MLKEALDQAYRAGVRAALRDAGMAKTAGVGRSLLEYAGSGLLGAGAGAGLGALSGGGDDAALRGALMGAGLGLGARGGLGAYKRIMRGAAPKTTIWSAPMTAGAAERGGSGAQYQIRSIEEAAANRAAARAKGLAAALGLGAAGTGAGVVGAGLASPY